MNVMMPKPHGIVDLLLTDIVRRIQLTPTEHQRAVDRYHAIADWIERDGSPFKGLVSNIYPQGGMAGGSTVSSNLENDEFDIDLMAELHQTFYDAQPRRLLDLLFTTINGDPGSLYHGKVTRKTRCVTVHYDTMHLDVTPAVLIGGMPRTSRIFHSKLEEPVSSDRTVVANPWGFNEWFQSMISTSPVWQPSFGKALDAEPVPDRLELHERSYALMALQLLKRWRNKRYDQRHGRQPPSILITCLVGEHAQTVMLGGYQPETLYSELLSQTKAMLDLFELQHAAGRLMHRANPACSDDILTDRWPCTVSDQMMFIQDLRELHVSLLRLGSDTTLTQKQAILSDLFGERVTKLAFDDYAKPLNTAAKATGIKYAVGTGGIVTGLPQAAIGSNIPTQHAPKHTFFGGARPERPKKW